MNEKLTKLITERYELQNAANYRENQMDKNGVFVTAKDEIKRSETDQIEEYDTDLVDFDFDVDDQTEFNVFMTIKYFWKDWCPIYSDIF